MNAPADVWRNFESGGGGSSSLYPGAPTYADAPAVMADLGAQSSLGTRRIMLWEPPGNATTVPGILGFPALSTVGTVTVRSPAVSGFKMERRIGLVSAGTPGAAAAIYCATATDLCPGVYADSALRGGFCWAATIRVSDASLVSGARMFVGLSYTLTAPTDSSPDSRPWQIGLGQIASSGNWYVLHGGGADAGSVDTGIAVNTSDLYTVEIASLPISGSTSITDVAYTATLRAGPGGPIVFSQNFVGTDSNLPHPAPFGTFFQRPFLSPCRIYRSNNGTAAAVGIDLCRIYCEEYL